MLSSLNGIPFLWPLVVIAFSGAGLGVRAWLGYRRLEADGAADWDYQVSQNMQDLRMTKDAYIRAFKKVNAPRSSLYLAAGVSILALITIPAFALIQAASWGIWIASDKSRDYEPGYLVWMFFIFFSIIAIWVFVGSLITRRYHRRAPGLMRDELNLERQDFMPEQSFIFSHDIIHLRAFTSERGDYRDFFSVLGMAASADEDWQGSGFACDKFSVGTERAIYVHIEPDESEHDTTLSFSRAIYPFFFLSEYARDDEMRKHYTLIARRPYAHQNMQAMDKCVASNTKSGSAKSNMCLLRYQDFDVYLYQQK